MKNDSKYIMFSDEEEYGDYLMHYGVLGMKWGVRRAGRAIKSGAKRVGRGAKKVASGTRKQAKSIAKKIKAKRSESEPKVKKNKTKKKSSSSSSIKDMSDSELDSAIRRMEKEKRYRELSSQENPPKSTFRSKLSKAAKEGIETGVRSLISQQIPKLGDAFIKEMIMDPVKRQQNQLLMKKNIKETEAWLNEFSRTGKRPDWEIGKGKKK